MSRTIRTAFTVASIALALTACSNPRTAPEVVAEAPATTEAAAPVTTEAAAPAEETEAPAQDEKSDEPAAPEVVPAQADEDSTPAPAPAAVAEHRSCSASQAADGGQYMVSGIAEDDADGGLVARSFAGTRYESRAVLPNFAAVDTYLDSADFPSCLVTTSGSVWWEIAHPSLAAGGWVNAAYLEPLADDHVDQPEEEGDAHADCVIFYGDDKCVVVYYAAGGISFVEPYDAEAAGELHLACVYNGNASACDVLAFVGPGDGIGNELTQTPTEFLVDDCANLTGIDQKLACAELATRS